MAFKGVADIKEGKHIRRQKGLVLNEAGNLSSVITHKGRVDV